MSDAIECANHGTREATFVCAHIHQGGKRGISPGFNVVPAKGEEFPDAWCDECEAYLQEHGGEWNEETESFTKIVLLCSDCYSEYRAFAESQGKLRTH